MSKYSLNNPSPRFTKLKELYREVHENGLENGTAGEKIFAGGSLLEHIAVVGQLVKFTGAKSILDYGSGKGALYREKDLTLPSGQVISSVKDFWGVEEIRCYDPGVNEYAARPESDYEGLVSTDVLEHIPEEDIDWVLAECFGFASKFLYMNIASYPAVKVLPNGWNAHITIKPPNWWRDRIENAAQGWGGKAYVFDVTEKRTGVVGKIARTVTGKKLKLTRIEAWS